MSIRIKVDLDGVTAKLSEKNFVKARTEMAKQMLADMNYFVPSSDPYSDGHLRASGHVVEGGRAIEWTPPYARAQFYGTNGIVTFQHYSTPGTGKRWDEKAKDIHMNHWKDIFIEEAGL
ncbi:minor capsid protein [Streptococcus satellite phage Javan292]|uniref:minor capsid protein n=1 Tax=Streptococcus marmotae TaxID=1825069 RepID=UPI0008349646|nr:minor capsid protein [Streptococcus marmotae]QBX08724.1 minor capsid protein [Streptococcus satellite phage Javan292]